jgi:signal peptidase I
MRAKHCRALCVPLNVAAGRFARLRRSIGALPVAGIVPLALVVTGVLAVRSSVADWNDVPTGSMQPTIAEGDRIVVDKLAYDLRLPFAGTRLVHLADPRRGDIVILSSPDDGVRLVKRVVGLPGDKVAIVGSRLIINRRTVSYGPVGDHVVQTLECRAGRRLIASEDLAGARHAVLVAPAEGAGRRFGPVRVPPNSYFVLGDNRESSLDSRYFGVVDRSLILGRAVAVLASIDPSPGFDPRWQRFLVALR